MRQHLRRAGLVFVVASVALSLPTPAGAYVGGPGSLSGGAGYSVLRAYDALSVGSTAAAAGTAGTAAGISGISYSAAASGAATTGAVAASVGITGWLQGWWNFGGGDENPDEKPAGLEVAPNPPGWSPRSLYTATMVTAPYGQWEIALSSSYAAVTDPYGTGAYPALTLNYAYDLLSGPMTGSYSFASQVNPVCRDTGGVLRPKTSSSFWKQFGSSGDAWVPGSGTVTVPAGTCTSGQVFEGWVVGQGMNGSATDATIATGLANGSVVIYRTPANPLAAAGTDGEEGTLTRSVSCTNGTTTNQFSDSVRVDIGKGASYEVPALECPAGWVASDFGSTWTPDTGTPQTLIPTTPTEPWVRDIPAMYPECAVTRCVLELYRTVPAPTTYCGALAIACPDWYSEPARADNYECRWGPYVVATDRCSVYRTPGQVQPNSVVKPDGTTEYTPWPVDALPAPGGQGDAEVDSSECWPTGYNAFNPVQWVYMPVTCALEWAFVPTQTQGVTAQIAAQVQTKTPVPQIGSLAAAFEVPDVGPACLKLSLPLSFVIGHDQPFLDSCTWSDPVSQMLRDHRVFLGACVWVGVAAPLLWWAWRTYAPGSTGAA